MELEYTNNEGFSVSINGEVEYNGEVICIKNEFRYCSNEQKINVLINLINWANDELDRINKG